MSIPTGEQLEFDQAEALEAATPGALRARFWRAGYLIVNGILSPAEAAAGAAVLDRRITLESSGSFVHTGWGTRRQLITPRNSIPELGAYAAHPRMAWLAQALIVGEVALKNEPIACVSFTGNIAGNLAANNWMGHTDGLPARPVAEEVGIEASIWLNFRDLLPGGGAMTMIPGSHWWIDQAVADPAFVKAKRERNLYFGHESYPGLDWRPVELCLRAGGVFVYYGYTIHNASDNGLPTPRQVCLYNFVERARIKGPPESRFDPQHLAVMGPGLRRLL